MTACAWCGQTFAPNTFGRPRVYCGVECRRKANYHAEHLAEWQAELAKFEAAALGYHGKVPRFLADEIRGLHDLIERTGATA
jgi:hypothetical protein